MYPDGPCVSCRTSAEGRLREFIQCDIDIIGSESNDSEIELILTTTKALQAIGMKNFKVKLNDRRLLRAVLMQMGFAENELDSVCITFDKIWIKSAWTV